MADGRDLHDGDHVSWQTHGTTTHGHIVQEITSDTEAVGRTVRATDDDPQYLVTSDKTGRQAVHRPAALRPGPVVTAPRDSSAATRRGSSAPGSNMADAGRRAADSAEDAGQQAMDSRPFRVLLTVGLIAYGVVHILIGWIALQIAWSGRGGERGGVAEGCAGRDRRAAVRRGRCCGSP